jgi:hypothetical protein
MHARLAKLGYADDAAQATKQVIDLVEQLSNVVSQELADVWKAVEWWDSSDSNEDELKNELQRFRDTVGWSLSEVHGEIAEIGSLVIDGDSVFFITLWKMVELEDGRCTSVKADGVFRVSARVSPYLAFVQTGSPVIITADQPDVQGIRRVYSFRRVGMG